MKRSLRLAAAVAAVVALAGLGGTAANAEGSRTVTVMTRNLYFGTDLTPVVDVIANPASTPSDVLGAVGNAFTSAQATDFAGRAAAWADEIAVTRPDLVGLQEAVQWRTGPLLAGNASTDAGDFVQLLLAALAARGQHYQLATESTGYDVEAPGLLPTGLADVRLTQHEAILARTDDGLTLANRQSGQFAAGEALTGNFGTFALPWSWASVDVTKGGRTFRFLTTHLDADVTANQLAQEQELLSGPLATPLPTVWVGDFNSDADAASITGTIPDTATYGTAIAAGFDDTWKATRRLDPGYTCCEDGDLLNSTPTLDQRIDLVLTRGAVTPLLDVLVGNTFLERLLFGRWPSDHAGVVATLELGR
jgi:endonuclease/exonuclease/phosphatase family metal-dependent hydrolase